MIVYDDCYNPTNVLGTRNIGDEEEKKKKEKAESECDRRAKEKRL